MVVSWGPRPPGSLTELARLGSGWGLAAAAFVRGRSRRAAGAGAAGRTSFTGTAIAAAGVGSARGATGVGGPDSRAASGFAPGGLGAGSCTLAGCRASAALAAGRSAGAGSATCAGCSAAGSRSAPGVAASVCGASVRTAAGCGTAAGGRNIIVVRIGGGAAAATRITALGALGIGAVLVLLGDTVGGVAGSSLAFVSDGAALGARQVGPRRLGGHPSTSATATPATRGGCSLGGAAGALALGVGTGGGAATVLGGLGCQQGGPGARIDLVGHFADQFSNQRGVGGDALEVDLDAGSLHQLLDVGLLLGQRQRDHGAVGTGAGRTA